MNQLIVFALGYWLGTTQNKKPKFSKPKRLSECADIIPGMRRIARPGPVWKQNVSQYRNLIENPYNFPN